MVVLAASMFSFEQNFPKSGCEAATFEQKLSSNRFKKSNYWTEGFHRKQKKLLRLQECNVNGHLYLQVVETKGKCNYVQFTNSNSCAGVLNRTVTYVYYSLMQISGQSYKHFYDCKLRLQSRTQYMQFSSLYGCRFINYVECFKRLTTDMRQTLVPADLSFNMNECFFYVFYGLKNKWHQK